MLFLEDLRKCLETSGTLHVWGGNKCICINTHHVTMPASHWSSSSSWSSAVHRRAMTRHLAPALMRERAPNCVCIAARSESEMPRSADADTAASTVSTSTTLRTILSALSGACDAAASPADLIAGRSDPCSRSSFVGRVAAISRCRDSPSSIGRRRGKWTPIGRRCGKPNSDRFAT